MLTSMSTLSIDVVPDGFEPGPGCTKCKSSTRLVGIEPHPTKAHTDVRTYQCRSCERLQAVVVPLTV
jgi:hypothetical protein